MKLDINILENYKNKKLIQRQQHPDFPLFIWNYTPQVQYERLWDEITLRSRALVTDFEGNIVGKSFNKFFNIEEIKNLPNESFEIY